MATDLPVIAPLSWSPDVYRLEQQAHQYPWPEDVLRSCFSGNYLNQEIRTVAGELAGYLITHLVADELTIMNIAVHPDFRRRGLALELIKWAQTLAADKGYTLWLEARESNAAAINLYRKAGFTEQGRRADYYSTDQGYEAALIMRWSDNPVNPHKT